MKAMWVIAWREFKSLATRPLFFGISGFCTTFWTYKYLRDLQAFALVSARPSLGGGEGPNIHFSLFVQQSFFCAFVDVVYYSRFDYAFVI